MSRGTIFLNVMVIMTVFILISALIGPSTGCFTTETIDKERQWACWNFNRGGGYTSRDMCCTGTTCECDETGNYTTNARFGRDCKCASTAGFVEEYYTRIMAEQQERINIMQQERQQQQQQQEKQQSTDDVKQSMKRVQQERSNSTKL